ncbi:MAG: hypothetical protein HIU85_10885 [Proteobacteria bacterium]|nr:hypothetical protein [Pseudomonadota bacterium]
MTAQRAASLCHDEGVGCGRAGLLGIRLGPVPDENAVDSRPREECEWRVLIVVFPRQRRASLMNALVQERGVGWWARLESNQ